MHLSGNKSPACFPALSYFTLYLTLCFPEPFCKCSQSIHWGVALATHWENQGEKQTQRVPVLGGGRGDRKEQNYQRHKAKIKAMGT